MLHHRPGFVVGNRGEGVRLRTSELLTSAAHCLETLPAQPWSNAKRSTVVPWRLTAAFLVLRRDSHQNTGIAIPQSLFVPVSCRPWRRMPRLATGSPVPIDQDRGPTFQPLCSSSQRPPESRPLSDRCSTVAGVSNTRLSPVTRVEPVLCFLQPLSPRPRTQPATLALARATFLCPSSCDRLATAAPHRLQTSPDVLHSADGRGDGLQAVCPRFEDR